MNGVFLKPKSFKNNLGAQYLMLVNTTGQTSESSGELAERLCSYGGQRRLEW